MPQLISLLGLGFQFLKRNICEVKIKYTGPFILCCVGRGWAKRPRTSWAQIVEFFKLCIVDEIKENGPKWYSCRIIMVLEFKF